MLHILRASLFALLIACSVEAQVIVNPPTSGGGGGGGATSPGAPENAVQFNVGSVFTGDSQFTWHATNGLVIGDQSALDPAISWYGFDGGQKVTVSMVGGDADTPWIGFLAQVSQNHANQDVIGSESVALLKQPAGATGGTVVGHVSDIYIDQDVASTNNNTQVVFEASAYSIGAGNSQSVSMFRSNGVNFSGGGRVGTVEEFSAGGASSDVDNWTAFSSPTPSSSPAVTARGFYLANLSGLSTPTKQAINYADKFVVDSAGNVSARALKAAALTFADLPTCNSGAEGSIQAVTNANTATWGATVTGTGSDHILAYCNGVNWTVLAK